MNTDTTTTTTQQSSSEQQIELQKWLSVVPIETWLLVLILALMATEAMPVWIGSGVIISGWVWFTSMEKKRLLDEATKRAAAYRNHIWPEVIGSSMPDEPVDAVKARAEEFKKKLIDSGNEYADVIPVLEMPYDPVMFDGPLSEAWVTYKKRLADFQMQTIKEWHERKCPKEMKHLYASGIYSQQQEASQ